MITTNIYPSLISIMPEGCKDSQCREYTIFQNEALSFQVAFRITDGSEKSTQFFLKVDTELPISCYYTGYVPVMHADFSTIEPVAPVGMYPDILIPKKVNARLNEQYSCGDKMYYEEDEKVLLCAYNDSWQGIWFVVNENERNMSAGDYVIHIELLGESGEQIGTCEVELEVLGQELPKQKLIYTNWFHYDCLADYYRIEIFSEEYFVIMRDFVRKAVRNGMNMLLVPAFTPPLDTAIGEERMTAQLVKIKVQDGEYEFDFSLLRKFLRMCQEDGIEYFEHSYLFTQWGACHAPKIMAQVDGSETRIFGWETDAAGEEYIRFLRIYLTELKKILREEGLEKRILFHISDEPEEKDFHNYETVYDKIADLLEEYMVGDALSNPKFMERGIVKLPIPRTKRAKEFEGKGVPIWCYYIGADVDRGMSNRLIQLPRERNRILGIQMYYHQIKGFLHWGYNFYYGKLCRGLFDPKVNPCGGFHNAGTSFIVYPAQDQTAYQSIRQKIFAEGINDMRVLELLESVTDRGVCENLIEAYFGKIDFYMAPEHPETLLEFRNAVVERIKLALEVR